MCCNLHTMVETSNLRLTREYDAWHVENCRVTTIGWEPLLIWWQDSFRTLLTTYVYENNHKYVCENLSLLTYDRIKIAPDWIANEELSPNVRLTHDFLLYIANYAEFIDDFSNNLFSNGDDLILEMFVTLLAFCSSFNVWFTYYVKCSLFYTSIR